MKIFKRFDDLVNIKMFVDLKYNDWLMHETSVPGMICITRFIPEHEQWVQHYVAYTHEKGWVIHDNASFLISSFTFNNEEIKNQTSSFYQFLATHGYDINESNILLPDADNCTQNQLLQKLSNHHVVPEVVFYDNTEVEYPPLVFKKISSAMEATQLLELCNCHWLICEGSTPGIVSIFTRDNCHHLGFTTDGWLLFATKNFKNNLLKLRPKEIAFHCQAFIEKLAEIGFNIFDADLLLPSIEQVTTKIPLQALQQLVQPEKAVVYSKLPILFFNLEIDESETPCIFKRMSRLEEFDELLRSQNKLWLLRETSIPGIIALHRYIPEKNSRICRRYACTEKEWVLIGNDLDALERHLLIANISAQENHEHNFYECLAKDGYFVEDENFLAPTSAYATQSKILNTLSLYPAIIQRNCLYP